MNDVKAEEGFVRATKTAIGETVATPLPERSGGSQTEVAGEGAATVSTGPLAGEGGSTSTASEQSGDRRFHPVAEIFPLLDDADLDELAADIGANGLREPICLHPNGEIIDGRNRFLACKAAGVEPSYRTWDGEGSLVDFVVSANLHRRHLSTSQRALVAAKIATARQGERTDLPSFEGRLSQADAARLLGVSVASVERVARAVRTGTGSLVRAIERGNVSVSRAADIAELPSA